MIVRGLGSSTCVCDPSLRRTTKSPTSKIPRIIRDRVLRGRTAFRRIRPRFAKLQFQPVAGPKSSSAVAPRNDIQMRPAHLFGDCPRQPNRRYSSLI
jgi:hypothetical protein